MPLRKTTLTLVSPVSPSWRPSSLSLVELSAWIQMRDSPRMAGLDRKCKVDLVTSTVDPYCMPLSNMMNKIYSFNDDNTFIKHVAYLQMS